MLILCTDGLRLDSILVTTLGEFRAYISTVKEINENTVRVIRTTEKNYPVGWL